MGKLAFGRPYGRKNVMVPMSPVMYNVYLTNIWCILISRHWPISVLFSMSTATFSSRSVRFWILVSGHWSLTQWHFQIFTPLMFLDPHGAFEAYGCLVSQFLFHILSSPATFFLPQFGPAPSRTIGRGTLEDRVSPSSPEFSKLYFLKLIFFKVHFPN